MIKYCRYYNEENKTENVVAYSTLDRMDKEVEEKHTFNGNNVLKFADTIEELCDYIIYTNFEGKLIIRELPLSTSIESIVRDVKLGLIKSDIKLAILTDSGLIYVARMNKKGCLELL